MTFFEVDPKIMTSEFSKVSTGKEYRQTEPELVLKLFEILPMTRVAKICRLCLRVDIQPQYDYCLLC